MAIQMRRGNLADFDPTKQMPGEFAVTLDTDSNLNKRVYIAFAAGTVKQLMTVEDATAQMIEATDAATAEAEAWAHGNSFTATEMFTSAGSATVTLAYSPSSINAVKINDVATTAYTRNGKVITFNTAPAVGSTITVIYGVSTSTDNAKYYKGQAANSATTASTKATQASTSATKAANSATTASTKATQAGNSATLAESYAVGGTGTRPGEDTDNAKYYKDQMATYLSGIYHFIGSVNSYADLPTMGMVNGDTYDILTADPTHEIAAGDNVAWTGTGWDKLSGTIATMIGATASSNGAKGLVPAPMIADKDNFLRGDGTWANPNTAVDDVYSVMGQMGAKNLIPYPYANSSITDHDVTFTVNNDGTVIANGTANGTAQFYLVLGNVSLSAAGNLVINTNKPLFLSGCPSGGSHSTFRIQYGLTDGTTYWAKTASDIGSGVKITPVDGLNSYCFVVIKIMVFNGTTVSNLTFKPMLRLAEDTDDTFQPYAKTNRQLTEDKAEVESVRDYINELGVKNLIPYPYVNTTQTINNVNFTDNGDGSISADNAASAITQFRLYGWTSGLSPLLLRKGTYILSGCPSGGGINSLRLYLHNQDSSFTAIDDGEGTQFTLSDDTYVGIAIRVANGYDADGKTVYPMLRLASDINDDTYVPFAMTNKQLTDEIATKAGISDVPTALSQLSGDSTHRLVTDTEKSTWNGKSNFSGSYNDLTNKPTIPTALSQLTADSTHRLVTDAEKTTWNTAKNRVEANTFGNSVSLKSYSSATNKYIVPNDGYITVYAGNGTEFRLYLDSASVGFEAMRISSTDGYTRQSIFVKKGIKVYGYPVPVSASTYEFNYYPLQ